MTKPLCFRPFSIITAIQAAVLLISLLLSSYSISNAQCYETIRTTSPTVNIWDWRARYWGVYYITSSGLSTYYNMDSPFYDVQNLNVRTLAQQTDVNKDFKPEDGWELIKKDLGTTAQATRAPYVVLYNKNTARLRVFFLVTQLYSEVGTTDAQQGGVIKVGFVNDPANAYQSNVLTAYAALVLPLDQFKRDIVINTPKAFQSVLPYWLYADFPMMYDPCTCQGKGQLFIRAQLINTAQVDITIKSLPYQSPVNGNSVNKDSDFLTGFGDFAANVEGGVKAANSLGEAAKKLTDAAGKIADPAFKSKVDKALTTVFGTGSPINAGTWISFFPSAYNTVKAATSLVEFFVSGGKSSSGGVAPSPVMIMNDFKATGTITSHYQKNSLYLSIPGSDQSSLNPDLVPVYNNVMGIMNLVETPEVKGKRYDRYLFFTPKSNSYNYLNESHITFQLQNTPKYVLNPALDIDYTVSEFNAALVIKNVTCGGGSLSNLQNEGGKDVRTSYYPYSCLNTVIARLSAKAAKESSISVPCAIGTPSDYNVYLKVSARLKRRNSTNPNEDIVFIASYPTKVTNMPVTNYWLGLDGSKPSPIPTNIEDNPEDVEIPDNTTYSRNTTVTALGNITVGANLVVSPTAQLVLKAAGDIIFPAGYTVPSNVVVNKRQVSILGSNCVSSSTPDNISRVAPLNASEVAAFCNSSKYKVANRSAARIGYESDEEEASVENAAFLENAYPNPFSQATLITYTLKQASEVSLYITDPMGRKVLTLTDNDLQEPGIYKTELGASALSPGVYIYTLQTGNNIQSKRLVVIK